MPVAYNYLAQFPTRLAFAGTKKSGKDFVADALVDQLGYQKFHIAEKWLQWWCAENGVRWNDYLSNKGYYRAAIQRDAATVRERNPDRLLGDVDTILRYIPDNIIFTGIRFVNEVEHLQRRGFFVVRVETPDDVRRQRFINDGEDLSLFNDSFEVEIGRLPVNAVVDGTLDYSRYYNTLGAAFSRWLNTHQ